MIAISTAVGLCGFALWAGWAARGLVAQYFTMRAVRRSLEMREQRRVPDPDDIEREWRDAVRERERVQADQSGARQLRIPSVLRRAHPAVERFEQLDQMARAARPARRGPA